VVRSDLGFLRNHQLAAPKARRSFLRHSVDDTDADNGADAADNADADDDE